MAHVPPHDEGAERAVVGSITIDESVADVVADIVTPEDFYQPSCKAVYEAALFCRAKGRPVDFQTLSTVLTARKQMELVGGLTGLTDMLDAVPMAANAEAYAETVREKAILRRLIYACREVAIAAYDAEDVETFLADSQARFTAATDHTSERPWEHVGPLASEQIDRLEASEPSLGVATGFHELDEMTKGLFPGQLIVVAGRPGQGKTAFAMSIVLQMADGNQGIRSLFCSLEMSKFAVTDRLISMITGIPISNVRAREVSHDDWHLLDDARRAIMELPIYVSDVPAMRLSAVRARARRLQAQHGVDLIVVDYLQLMKASAAKDANREQQVASISAGLKEIAKEFNVPVIALSQLNRAVEGRPDKRPGMSDLRESGAIEQDADVIAFVYRDEHYNPDSVDKGKAEIIIAKQRDGITGTLKLDFDGPRVIFRQPGNSNPLVSHAPRSRHEPAPDQPQPKPPPSPQQVQRAEQIVGWFDELGVSEDFLIDKFGVKSGWDDDVVAEIRVMYKQFKETGGDGCAT